MLGRIFGRYADYGVLFIRFGLFAIFFGHGSGKLFGLFGGSGLKGVAGFLSTLGFGPPMFWAIILACTEFFGAIFILFGFLTRWAATGISIVMLVAIFKVHWTAGLYGQGGYEHPFALLMMALALLFRGGGKLSLDNVLFKPKKKVYV